MSESPADFTSTAIAEQRPAKAPAEGVLPRLVAHLRTNRTALREKWACSITAASPEEIFSEAAAVYDNYVEVRETGSVEALQDYARDLSERIIPRGVETDDPPAAGGDP